MELELRGETELTNAGQPLFLRSVGEPPPPITIRLRPEDIRRASGAHRVRVWAQDLVVSPAPAA